MSSSSPSHGAKTSLPYIAIDRQRHVSEIPIHVVTQPFQLPREFIAPSSGSELVVGLDCEGVDLSRNGTLCIIQLAFPDGIYLVDVIEGGEGVVNACKPGLESCHVTKVIHDCKRDSEALYFQFGVKLHNVFDTQIAYSMLEEKEGKPRSPDANISFVGLVADPRYCGISLDDKEGIRALLRQDPNFWKYRPLSELMINGASNDVRYLLHIYEKMKEKFDHRTLWHLAVRGALYCRCFCFSDEVVESWPELPKVPDDLSMEGQHPEEETLSVLDIPEGKMGRIIGRRGASISAIKQWCKAEIVIGDSRGPPNKVFIMGPVTQVRKAEAIVRGKIMDMS